MMENGAALGFFGEFKTIGSIIVVLQMVEVEKVLLRVLAPLRRSNLGPYQVQGSSRLPYGASAALLIDI